MVEYVLTQNLNKLTICLFSQIMSKILCINTHYSSFYLLNELNNLFLQLSDIQFLLFMCSSILWILQTSGSEFFSKYHLICFSILDTHRLLLNLEIMFDSPICGRKLFFIFDLKFIKAQRSFHFWILLHIERFWCRLFSLSPMTVNLLKKDVGNKYN